MKDKLKKIFGRKNTLTAKVFELENSYDLMFTPQVVQGRLYKEKFHKLALEYLEYMALSFLMGPSHGEVCQIGLGLGNLASYIHMYYPKLSQLIVEPYSSVIELFKQYQPDLFDAIDIAECQASEVFDYDIDVDYIIVDAFDQHGVSSEVKNTEFVYDSFEALKLEGVFCMNCWSRSGNLTEMIEIIKGAYPYIAWAKVPLKGNVIIYARKIPLFTNQKSLMSLQPEQFSHPVIPMLANIESFSGPLFKL